MVESLEREMELLCLTGVEDQLQADVRPTLEMLRNAGIKVLSTAWRLPCATQLRQWQVRGFVSRGSACLLGGQPPCLSDTVGPWGHPHRVCPPNPPQLLPGRLHALSLAPGPGSSTPKPPC